MEVEREDGDRSGVNKFNAGVLNGEQEESKKKQMKRKETKIHRRWERSSQGACERTVDVLTDAPIANSEESWRGANFVPQYWWTPSLNFAPSQRPSTRTHKQTHFPPDTRLRFVRG